MKTLIAAIGALALATTAASADGDGGKAQKEFYAVARGDYSLRAAEATERRYVPTGLRSTAPAEVAKARARAAEAARR